MPIPVIYIAVAMLFLGAAPVPYGYYMLLRIVATIVFVWAGIIAHGRKKDVMPWVFGILAILFNPIIMIHLPKEVWVVVDVAAGLLLLVSKTSIQEHRDENF